MPFPLTFSDISLWIAVIALILLATSDILSHGETGIVIEEKRLKMIAVFFALSFLLIVMLRIYQKAIL